MSPGLLDLVFVLAIGAIGGALGGIAAAVYLEAETLFGRVTWVDGVSRFDKARTAIGWIHLRTDWRHVFTWVVPRAAALGAAFGATLLVVGTGLWVIFT